MEISELPKDKKIILFDGVCNLCDSSVQFVIKHDKKDVFRFIPLQSKLGQQIIYHIGISASTIDSVILYESKNVINYKAEAALRILKELNTCYRFLLIVSIFPKSILNLIYDFVAKNRYKWFGKKDCCIIPSTDFKSKFLA